MRSITIGRYQASLLFLIIVAIACPMVIAATYLWTVKTIPFSVEEPLSIADYPTAFHVHPGENKTLDITVQNSATVNYSVTLVLALNDTAYQQSYVTTSNYTYTVIPSTNYITAWIYVEKKAPSAELELQVDFYRE